MEDSMDRRSKFQQSCWGRRTRLEKFLIVVVVVILIILVIFTIIVAIKFTADRSAAAQSNAVCLTEQCVKIAARIMESADQTVDPCSDFYQFACGQWNHDHPIPDERTKYDVFAMLNDVLQDRLKSLLEQPVGDEDVSAVRKTKFLYQSCINLTALDDQEDEAFKHIVNELGGWPIIDQTWNNPNFDLVEVLGRLRSSSYGSTPLLIFYVNVDERNSTYHRILIDQPAQLPMTHRNYYLQGRNTKLMEVYSQFAINVAKAHGADESLAKQDVDELIDFEIELANITLPLDEQRRRRESQYNKFTIREMSTNLTDTIDWLKYLSNAFNEVGINITETQEVIVRYPDYIYELGQLLQRTSPRTLQNYIIWWVLTTTGYDLVSQKFQALGRDFSKELLGTDKKIARWRSCVSFVNHHFGTAVGRMYIERYFSKEARENALTMVGHVRRSFSEILQELTWLEDSTKKVAHEKVDAMRAKIAYPNFILNDTALDADYEEIHCSPDKFFMNNINISQVSVRSNLRDLTRPYDRDSWDSTPVIPNAYYHPAKNIIMFPAGILQPPFYHKNNPKYLNFGGIAAIIGHEITHGFDDHGRLFDKYGNLKQWWSSVDIDKFKERAQCFVDQYNNYTVPEVNMNVNGRQTLGENIADNGGLKQSYRAYMRWIEENGEEVLLPGVNYTQAQLFFLNFAQMWCGSSRPEVQLRSMLSFPHSPRNIRVIGTLSNSPEFADAYRCPTDSPMNPVHKCSVW